jgi:hypothetical protein
MRGESCVCDLAWPEDYFWRKLMINGIAAVARTLAVFMLALSSTVGWAEEAGKVKNVTGEVSIIRGNETIVAKPGVKVLTVDQIRTGKDSSVGITLKDNTILSAGPNSLVSIDEFEFDTTTYQGKLDASVKKGTLSVISGKLAKNSPESVKFRTPSTTLGVRGTEFIIDVGN